MEPISNIIYMMYPLYRLQVNPVQGEFNAEHLKMIHRTALDNFYPWCGKYREHTLWRFPSSDFAPPDKIPYEIDHTLKAYKESKDELPVKCATLQWELNHIHPFHDGNGRTQREFIREICIQEGCIFDLSFTKAKDMFTASRSKDPGDMTDIFRQAIKKHDDPQSFYETCGYITILSHDDVPEEAKQFFISHLPKVGKKI